MVQHAHFPPAHPCPPHHAPAACLLQADKKLDLWSLPEVLVVHLKRFSYTRWHREKIDTEVAFPLQGLSLSAFQLHQQDHEPVYDLFAVSNHFGGLGGGHYTAYGVMPDDHQWYCFDDSRVEHVDAESVSGWETAVKSFAGSTWFVHLHVYTAGYGMLLSHTCMAD